MVEKILEVDPTVGIQGIAEMLRQNITMPTFLMHDSENPDLFKNFSRHKEAWHLHNRRSLLGDGSWRSWWASKTVKPRKPRILFVGCHIRFGGYKNEPKNRPRR
ncbi:hypothetical protein NE237_001448 [Protea cynaroides]|uniref:Uncharacterized protein n=1 Tax=Protea cynaroides TaxID=273540 RepID=A0A9Q0KT41_9MAGN|nr:hypothetical protein NE237_001448 [Protea cynaroides]